MVEDEDLVAEYRETVQVVGPLLMRDGDDGSLQTRHVRLERDRYLVAKTSLHASADRAQKPRGRRGDTKRNRSGVDEDRPPFEHSLTKHLKPERQQRIGQRG